MNPSSLEMNEFAQQPMMPSSQPPPSSSPPMDGLDSATIQQLVSGLQQASLTGATQLPSRDIPNHHTAIDPHTNPSHIPPASRQNYITAAPDGHAHSLYHQNQSLHDFLLQESPLPLLAAVLYFIFLLPFVKVHFTRMFPFFITDTGNYTFYGMLTISGIFGLAFYGLRKYVL